MALVYVEEVEDHSAALKREAQIKGYKHQRKAEMAAACQVPEDFLEGF